MQNTDLNSLSTAELQEYGKAFRFFNWLQAVQDDLSKIPTIYNASDCKEVGGNKTFPPLPTNKTGLLFLSSGTYEAAVVASADKWRRLYDGATFDPTANIP